MVRVHELATDLEVPSSKVLEILDALGVKGRNHSSVVSDAEAEKIRRATASTSTRVSRVSGKRDFRVRDISSPSAKSPAIRPRPTMQTQETGKRVVTRKVVKRVVRRSSTGTEQAVEEKPVETPPREVARPELPDIEKAVSDIDKSFTSIGTEPEKAEPVRTPEPPAAKSDKPSGTAVRDDKTRPPRERRRRRGRDRDRDRDNRDKPRREATDNRPQRPQSDKLSTQVYTPVGKGEDPKARRRPPRPKVPKIPQPEDYLNPRASTLEKSMEKLVTSGMKSSIDKRPPKGKAPLKPDAQGQRKRRRKIIKDDKKVKSPQGGRGRRGSVHQQVQSQLDTSTTVRKRGRRRGRDRDSMRQAVTALPKIIKLGEHTMIKELSAQAGLKSSEIISFLMKELEVFATINQTVDQEIAGLICDHFGFEYELTKIKEIEDVLKHEEDRLEDMVTRPPVVTVLGHVDHGKTKLLDAIRGTDVVATEAGGITQKIGAFQVKAVSGKDGKTRPVTFIDTPGHAAFTAMRARGAQVTDIAVLVVAADDGVMPQTLEAIDHARSAGVEIIVAINKIDLPGANPDLVKQQLSEHGLVPEEWGGQIIMAPISAKKKIGIEDLLDQILTVTDILELKANPLGMAEGAIIEARLDKGRGALATVLIQRGTLNVGDYVVVGCSWGRVRQMTDEVGRDLTEAGPSTPILISGLNQVPAAGDKLNEVKDERTAREIYDKREMDHRQGRLRMVNTISLEDFYQQLSKGELKELNIILKADFQGSIEALRGQLEQLSTDEVAVKFIHTAVGNITDSDIMLAMASRAVILGFNVVASPEIRKQAAMEGIDIMTYNIIYKAVDEVRAALEGLLEPEFREDTTSESEVRAIFKRTGKVVVAGIYVTSGKLARSSDIRVFRDGEKVYEGHLASLKRFKDDVKEVEHGTECGIMIDNFNDLREGDRIVSHETVKILRTLESTRREKQPATT